MFRNYFRIAYRNLRKDKTSAAISILGLATGLACCMLILLFIKDEFSYNTFNRNKDNIYGLNWTTRQSDGTLFTGATTPLPFAPVIAPRISGIQATARLYQRSGEMQAGRIAGAARFQEQQVFFTESTLFDIFTIPFVAGKGGNSALAAPNTVVITDETANKYFGSSDVLGKTLLYEDRHLLQITGVVKKMPANSDLQFDFLVSLETVYNVEPADAATFIKNDWTFATSYTYMLLKPGVSTGAVERQLNGLLKQYGNDRNRQMNRVSLQPLSNIHLYAADVQNNPSSGSITYTYIFAGIALLILFIANV